MNFINMVHFSAFLGPIASTTTLAAFLESTQGDKDYTSLLPDHLPEVGEGGWKWRLGGHVSWGTWIMIGLERKLFVNVMALKILENSLLSMHLCNPFPPHWLND